MDTQMCAIYFTSIVARMCANNTQTHPVIAGERTATLCEILSNTEHNHEFVACMDMCVHMLLSYSRVVTRALRSDDRCRLCARKAFAVCTNEKTRSEWRATFVDRIDTHADCVCGTRTEHTRKQSHACGERVRYECGRCSVCVNITVSVCVCILVVWQKRCALMFDFDYRRSGPNRMRCRLFAHFGSHHHALVAYYCCCVVSDELTPHPKHLCRSNRSDRQTPLWVMVCFHIAECWNEHYWRRRYLHMRWIWCGTVDRRTRRCSTVVSTICSNTTYVALTFAWMDIINKLLKNLELFHASVSL